MSLNRVEPNVNIRSLKRVYERPRMHKYQDTLKYVMESVTKKNASYVKVNLDILDNDMIEDIKKRGFVVDILESTKTLIISGWSDV